MSVNFHDSVCTLVGVDLHNGDVSQLHGPFLTYIPFLGIWMYTLGKHAKTVTTRGFRVFQDGCEWFAVPHAPTNQAMLPDLPFIIAKSSSKMFMSVHSVTAEKTPIATTIFEFIGANANCGDPTLPSGVVLQLNTVKTEPTLGDYAGALASLLVEFALSGLTKDKPDVHDIVEGVLRLLNSQGLETDHPLKQLLQKLNLPIDPTDPSGESKKMVQQVVDDMLQDIVDE